MKNPAVRPFSPFSTFLQKNDEVEIRTSISTAATHNFFVLLFQHHWIHNPYLAVTFLTLSAAAKALSTPAYWALSGDMAPRHAGILSSIINTSGNVAGVIAPVLTGWLVSYFSGWNQAIWVGAVVTLLGVGVAFPTIRSSEID